MNVAILIGAIVGGFIAGVVLFAYFLAQMQANLNGAFIQSPEVCKMVKKKKFELVENWRQAWRWISVNCMVVAIAVQGTWASLEADQRASIPGWAVTALTIALLGLGVIGRLVKQPEPPK